MNTEIANNGIEVYTDQLFRLADEYIIKILGGDETLLDKRFRDLILYISDRLDKPPHEDIGALDRLFKAYVRLCTRYEKLPTLGCFALLTGINRATFCDWSNGEYRKLSGHGNIVKSWKDTCRIFVEDELNNSHVANVNLIFVSKAVYGLRETSPLPAEPAEVKHLLSVDHLPVLPLPDTPENELSDNKMPNCLPCLDNNS